MTQLKAPAFIDILIKNTGNVDIPKTDFDEYIKFSFENSKPIRVKQISSSADSLMSSPEIYNNNIRIPPLLLNANDYFTIRVLLDGIPTKITPHLRFLGMDSDFDKVQESNGYSRMDYTSIFMVIIAFIVMGRLISIEIFNVELHRWDIMLSMFTVYTLGLILAQQTQYLSDFSMPIELLILFSPAAISCFASWYLSTTAAK